MVYRVIISHGQAESLRRFPVGAPTIVVLDAPTAEDLQACRELGYTPVLAPQSGNRGANRDIGLAHLLGSYSLEGDDIVEFFDGDRYPIRHDTDATLALFDTHGLDVLLYACEDDARSERVFIPNVGAALVDTGTMCNPFYSCGFAIKASAIRQVQAFNGGTLFESRFTRWGCEDQYLGLVCDRLQLKVAITGAVLLNGHVGGDAGLHQEYRDSLQQYVDLILEKKFEVRSEPRPSRLLQ